jgi:integrase
VDFDKSACSCPHGPTYFVALRRDGRLIRERVGRNRRDAERALARITTAVEDGAYTAPRAISFGQFVDEWHAELRGVKESTRSSYSDTIKVAREAFGHKRVRDVGPADVLAMVRILEARPRTSASTCAKHVRVVGTMFASAEKAGLVAQNPVRRLSRSQRPRPARREASYFDDAELVVLAREMPEGMPRVAFQLALGTGVRLSEGIALTWGDVALTEGRLAVRRTWTKYGGPTTEPKGNARRDVYLPEPLQRLLAEWWADCGKPGDDVLVLAAAGGYVKPRYLLRQLQAAMKRGGVNEQHPRTGTKRTWHSLRHSHARCALEAGASLDWVRQQLGHSTPVLTANTYGTWAAEGRRREAEKLAAAFPTFPQSASVPANVPAHPESSSTERTANGA